MRSPSARVLINTVDHYAGVQVPDAVGAPQFTYPSLTAPGVACSVQYMETGEDVETFERITVVNVYHIMYGSDPRLKPRDKVVWRDPSPYRTLFVLSNPPSEAGRDAAWVVRAVEKV